ncbi:MAG: MoaD/ThiS family protein [Flavobacteriales bacterium]|nr:MoaD/ThiS family protein [Flavobacteriales bacterium]
MRTFSVICFGMMAEWAEGSHQELKLEEPATVRDVRKAAEQRWPRIQGITYRVAVNQRLAHDAEIVLQTDEIALMPPFAGG